MFMDQKTQDVNFTQINVLVKCRNYQNSNTCIFKLETNFQMHVEMEMI